MEEEYDWGIIAKVAAPIGGIVAYIFYTGISDVWKWLSLLVAISLTGMITYMYNKKKSNVFTAIGLVFLVALIIKFFRNLGIL